MMVEILSLCWLGGGYVTWKTNEDNTAIATNTEAFTARVVVKVTNVMNSNIEDTDFGISFVSQPEDTYGDNYSMDISNVSVLDFSSYNYLINLSNTGGDVDDLTLKLYKANITNDGINLRNNGTVSNTNITVTGCNINSNDGSIYISVNNNSNGTVSNTNITVTGCNISNTNGSIYISVINNNSNGTVSNSSVTVTDCNINSYENIYIYTHAGGKISNSITSISNTTMEYKSSYKFIDQKYINGITLSLDNVVVTKL